MKILFLVTPHPTFRHWKSVELNAAILIKAWCDLGHEVVWATASNENDRDEECIAQLTGLGATYLGDYSEHLVRWPRGKLGQRLALVKSGFGEFGDDAVRFRDPKGLATQLVAECQADVAILLWDSIYEHLLAHLSIPTVAYLARPPYASTQTEFEESTSAPANPITRFLVARHLAGWTQRHLVRVAQASVRANICAIDAAYYDNLGIPCSYLANTWQDVIGDEWEEARRKADAIGVFQILGAMGSATTSGTMQGIKFWSTEVLPVLEQRMGAKRDWAISVCGRNVEKLPPEILARLDNPHIAMKYFVDDIDFEVLSSSVFLMCNNAGPYTGGYTRVIYAMATGACLIAHKRLANSMPEVRHGENALLGETGEEIAALIEQAYQDDGLRKNIGRGARKTYETEFHPNVIAHSLVEYGRKALSEARSEGASCC